MDLGVTLLSEMGEVSMVFEELESERLESSPLNLPEASTTLMEKEPLPTLVG